MEPGIGIDLSDHEVVPMLLRNQQAISDLIRNGIPASDEQRIAARDLPCRLTYEIIIPARLWLTNEARKKGVRKYRDLLKKAIDYRETFRLPYIAGDGTRKTEYPLRAFPAPTDHLETLIAQCDEILGREEPARYPRRKIITEILRLWHEYGQSISPTASIPSKRERQKTAISYQLCRLVLTAIEGKPPGDFSLIYDKISGSETFQK